MQKEQGMGKIVLASTSPRRREILKDYKLEIIPSPFIETHTKTDFSYAYVENLAYNKAKSVADTLDGDVIVTGADTVVVLDKEILEKPKNEQDAFDMLKKLSNRTHKVVTAISMIKLPQKIVKTVSTTSEVTFADLSDDMINFYIENFKPFDKAGSYGIQEMPDGYIKSVDGDFENIIGISSKVFKQMLDEIQNL